MLVPRNIQFTRLIKVSGRLKEFNFRKRNLENGPQYDVDVSDERNNRYCFTMLNTSLGWKISPGTLPSWIADIEPGLHDAILKEEEAMLM